MAIYGIIIVAMGLPSPDQITQLLLHWSEGDECALDEIVPLVYNDLHRMAAHQLRSERSGHTLQPTALVNEAYVKLADHSILEWRNRAHFLAVASHAMRQILIDYARSRNRKKRGGKHLILPLDEVLVFTPERSSALIALDAALERLSQEDSRKARVVELRFFGGLSNEEISSALGISPNTVIRDWNYSQARLMQLIAGNQHDGRQQKKD